MSKELRGVTRAEELAEEIRQLASRVASDVVEIGGRLIEARKILKAEGKWMDWLQTEFGWAQQTASNFIRAAELVKEHPRLLAFESPSILYMLSDPSEETIDRLLMAKDYNEARQVVEAEKWDKRTRAKLIALARIDYDQVRATNNWKTMDLAKATASRILAEMDQAMDIPTARPTAVLLYRDYGEWLAELTETDSIENTQGLTLRERHGEPANGRVRAKLYEEDRLTRLTVWCPDPFDVVLFPRTGSAQADAWRVTFMEACLTAAGGTDD